MSTDAISSIGGSSSSSPVSSISRVAEKERPEKYEDNIFAANFNGADGAGVKGPEEVSGTLASKEPSGNLFEESQGQLASNNDRDLKFEESQGQLAQGRLDLVA